MSLSKKNQIPVSWHTKRLDKKWKNDSTLRNDLLIASIAREFQKGQQTHRFNTFAPKDINGNFITKQRCSILTYQLWCEHLVLDSHTFGHIRLMLQKSGEPSPVDMVVFLSHYLRRVSKHHPRWWLFAHLVGLRLPRGFTRFISWGCAHPNNDHLWYDDHDDYGEFSRCKMV